MFRMFIMMRSFEKPAPSVIEIQVTNLRIGQLLQVWRLSQVVKVNFEIY